MAPFEHGEVTQKIIGCCFEVHKALGPGFNEKIYSNALQMQLHKTGVKFDAEKEFNVYFDGHSIGKFRVDLFVDEKIIVELKAVTGPLFRNSFKNNCYRI
jgi:GxxExxY protein